MATAGMNLQHGQMGRGGVVSVGAVAAALDASFPATGAARSTIIQVDSDAEEEILVGSSQGQYLRIAPGQMATLPGSPRAIHAKSFEGGTVAVRYVALY